MLQVLTEFASLLVGAITTVATGVAQGIAGMAEALFVTKSEGVVSGLSVFGGIMGIFGGITLAIGITTRVYLWVTSLGHN